MRFLTPLLVLMLMVGVASGEVLDATKEGTAGTGSEGAIEDASAPSTIDNHIRQNLQQVRKRAQVEAHWGTGDGLNDDNGVARLGSARCYFQASAPTGLDDSGSTGIADYDNSIETEFGGATDLNDFATNSAEGIIDDLGHGRCWIDSDDNNQLYVYRGVAGNDTPSTIAEGWEPVNQARGYINLIANGSFEQTDGDGDVDATAIPIGWTVTASPPTYTYVNIVSGLSLLTEGDGFGVVLEASAGDEGITQTLSGLKPSTQYRFRVRAHAPATEDCQLAVTGQGSVIPSAAEAETATNAVFETLELLVTTDSTPTDLVFILRSEESGDTCTFDHASVVEVAPVLNTAPRRVVFTTTNSTVVSCDSDYTGTCAALAAVEVTPPGPGYFVEAHGSVNWDAGNTGQCMLELHDGSGQLAEVGLDPGAELDITAPIAYYSTAPLTSGSTVTFTLRGKIGAGTCDTAPSATVFSAENQLTVILVR